MVKNPKCERDGNTLRSRRKREKSSLEEPLPQLAREEDGHRVQLEALLEAIREGFICVGWDGRCMYVNAAAAGFLRHSAEDLAGRPLLDIFPEAGNVAFEAALRKALDQRVSTALEVCSAPLQAWFECRCYPSPEGVCILFTDVTARQRAQESLQENEQRLRLMLEGGGTGHWEWDLRTNAMSWCERAYQLLGLDAFWKAKMETLLGRVHPNDRDALQQLLATVVTEPRDFDAEFRVLRPAEVHGEISWLAARAKVIRDEQGRAIRMIGVLYDITRRKEMEAELKRLNEHLEEEVHSQIEELTEAVERLQGEVVRRVLAEGKLRRRSQMLEAFFQHTITPLVFLDRYFNFVRVNRAYARAAGEDPDFFAGKNYFVLRPHEEDRPVFEQVVRTKQPYFAHAKPFVDPHHPQRPITYWDWHLTPLLSDSGQVQSLVLNLVDVTEAQEAYAALEHRAGQLQKLTLELSQAEDRERKRISELLHEDVQQVLAAAKFHLNLLRQRVHEDEELREIGEEVAQMLNDAIGKSRSLSHELSPALYQFDLDEMLAWLIRNMAQRHGLAVTLQVRGPLHLPPEPIKAMLYKVAQELLFNVVKHAGVRQATVRLHSMRGRLRLTVSDQGKGFDRAALAETAGFGLMSIRERIGLLGGCIKIRSAPAQGCIICVALPAAAPSPGTQANGTGREGSSALAGHLDRPRRPGSGSS